MAEREAGCLEIVDWLRHSNRAIDDTQQIAYQRQELSWRCMPDP